MLGLPGNGIMVSFFRILSRLLRIAYRLLYYQLAWTYDLVAWIVSGGEWAEWRHCVFPFLLPGRVLEAAHGTGTLAIEMAARGFNVTAFDLSPAMSEIARRKKWAALRHALGGVQPQNPFLIRSDIFRIPLRDESFANVVSTFPAEFVADTAAMREIHRVLLPGGRWIIIPTAYPIWLEKIARGNGRRINQPMFIPGLQAGMEVSGFRLRTEYFRRPNSVVVVWIAEKALK
jgi:ubiquinone/menaquinone biosynthesis C-methylase UbiE